MSKSITRATNSYERIINISLNVLILLSICFIGVTNLFFYTYKMDADIAAESLLASVIWSTGEWIPHSWYPSTELRFVTTPNLASLFYGVTGSLQWCMGIACTVMTLLIACCGYAFTKVLGLSKIPGKVFLLLLLALPNHFVILELTYLFAGYYATHAVVIFLTLCAYVLLYRKSKSLVTLLLSVLTLIASLLLGVQGVRSLLILSVPLLLTELLRVVYSLTIYRKKISFLPAVYCLLMVIAGFIGTRSPASVAVNSSTNIRAGILKFFTVALPDLIKCVGLRDSFIVARIFILLLLLLALYQVVVYVKALITDAVNILIKKQDSSSAASDSNIETWLLCYFTLSPLLSMAASSFMTVDSSERYYSVILYQIAFACALFLEHRDNFKIIPNIKPKHILSTVCCLVLLTASFNLAGTYGPVFMGPSRAQDFKEVADFLENTHYRIGYATFDHAGPITVVSDGKVVIGAVSTVEKMNVCKWLNCSDWFVPNVPVDQPTAYIISDKQLDRFQTFLEESPYPCGLIGQVNHYYIYASQYNGSCMDD